MKGLKKGDLVEVSFYDHAQGDGTIDVVECIVVGKIQDVDDLRIIINSWICEDDKHNYESFAILCNVITDVIKWVEGIKIPIE
jgi:hypothetical protein